ncbi:hypothetical protein FOZ63_007215 [Perkinsus olseni]|uniref:Purple acid phosphatase n=2 Tax=Perkinsus olseni TaxID=32597 RepID=A0A7J6S346_PEROL|nr:hypothetical protein FOZ63_007215 [Perkinsus olseni]
MPSLVDHPIGKVAPAVLLVAFFCHLAGCSSSSSATTTSTPPATTVRPPTSSPSNCRGSHFRLNPSVLQHSYDPVNIQLAEGRQPLAGDTIVFSPKDTPSLSMLRVLVSALNGSDGYDVRPVNPRGGGYTVSYRTANGSEVCSTDLTFAQGDDEPTQAHVTVVGDGNLQVHWVSASSLRGSVSYQRPGTTAPTRYDETSSPRTYKAQDMCTTPATGQGFRDPGYFHSVTIPNVAQGSTIRITTGSGTSRAFTPSPRLVAGDPLRHSVFLVGDLGTTGGGVLGGVSGFGVLQFPDPDPGRVLAHVRANEKFRLSIIYGDIAYAGGFSTVWDQHGEESGSTIGMSYPLVASVGNHEYVSFNNSEGWYPDFGNYKFPDSGGECGVPFSHRYPVGDGSKANYWFSFDFGLVHYVMMSTEHNYLNGSAQHQWLADDLASVNRTKTPWVIVTGHRPMHSPCPFGKFNGEIADALKSDVAPLLKKYKVDLYFTGHLHRYARTPPIDGTVHLLAGSGRFLESPCSAKGASPMEKALDIVGYVELDVVGRNELRGTFWGYNATINEMTVQDTFAIGNS